MEEAVEAQVRTLMMASTKGTATSRIAMVRHGQKRLAKRGIATEPLRPANQPQIELVLRRAKVGEQLRVISLGIIDEIAWVDLEKLRQQKPRRIGKVRTGPAFNLREIRLADSGFARLLSGGVLLLDRPDKLLLRHSTVEPAKVTFNLPQITDFVAEFHWLLQIAIFISQFVIFVNETLWRTKNSELSPSDRGQPEAY